MAAVRVDVMTTIDAVVFNDAWNRRVEAQLGGISISIISLQDLIRNKVRWPGQRPPSPGSLAQARQTVITVRWRITAVSQIVSAIFCSGIRESSVLAHCERAGEAGQQPVKINRHPAFSPS
jgi:hypothetical protein